MLFRCCSFRSFLFIFYEWYWEEWNNHRKQAVSVEAENGFWTIQLEINYGVVSKCSRESCPWGVLVGLTGGYLLKDLRIIKHSKRGDKLGRGYNETVKLNYDEKSKHLSNKLFKLNRYLVLTLLSLSWRSAKLSGAVTEKDGLQPLGECLLKTNNLLFE